MNQLQSQLNDLKVDLDYWTAQKDSLSSEFGNTLEAVEQTKKNTEDELKAKRDEKITIKNKIQYHMGMQSQAQQKKEFCDSLLRDPNGNAQFQEDCVKPYLPRTYDWVLGNQIISHQNAANALTNMLPALENDIALLEDKLMRINQTIGQFKPVNDAYNEAKAAYDGVKKRMDDIQAEIDKINVMRDAKLAEMRAANCDMHAAEKIDCGNVNGGGNNSGGPGDIFDLGDTDGSSESGMSDFGGSSGFSRSGSGQMFDMSGGTVKSGGVVKSVGF